MTRGRDAGDAEARVARRLAARPSAETFVGVCVHVVDAALHAERGARIRTPDHWLAAAWAARGRRAFALARGGGDRLAHRHLRARPPPVAAAPRATLFLAGRDDVDAALAAEILLEADRNLEPYQRAGVARFVEAERSRTRRAIAERYTDRDAGFERFRARMLGAPAR